MTKRKEEKVKNNPGIYKQFLWDTHSESWKETGRYRAVKRLSIAPFKLQKIFESFHDAKAFLKEVNEVAVQESQSQKPVPTTSLTFSELLTTWKESHYAKIEFTTKQHYESRIPHFEILKNCPVENIDSGSISNLISYWVSPAFHKPKDRHNFEKELEVLTVILNFYRKNINQRYYMPISREHYTNADFSKKEPKSVRGLKEKDIGPFLSLLNEKYPHYYPIALLQIGLGLRIGEACGLYWSDFDLESGASVVQRSIAWNKESGRLTPKRRKNRKKLDTIMPKFVTTVLKELLKQRDYKVEYVFHMQGVPIRRQYVARAYNKILRELGVSYVSGTHMLRKTACIQTRRLTKDIYVASKLLGHGSVAVTEKHYQEHLDEDKQKAADALNSVLEKALGAHPNPPTKKDDSVPSIPQSPALKGKPKLTLIKSAS